MKSSTLTLVLCGVVVSGAFAQYRLPHSTISSGGGVSSGGTYRATAVIGQPGIAPASEAGTYTVRSGFLFIPSQLLPTGVQPARNELPTEFALGQNFPNPFNPTTTIPFSLKTRSYVTLRLFDSLGREVATLLQGNLDAGHHTVTVDASTLPSGVYFYRLEAGTFTALRKAALLK
ncbi:MAG: T9SS type A sorting domain-containing protein [candidate division KSB1 bacterium]|nr:T9SS type A sorting domain-containing protein [candidate division KSB1 bacterium]MDZ7378747.1 T9SS type A sorting domain-containing protein [candidate division KSB1 bacterium]MDZ7413721.1 T9SS type A sorting domain-containing protein [candidate division KSB1 bacterium]